MTRIAFKMKLLSGFAEEYQKRHDSLWTDVKALLKETGISDYSIFIDEETNILFGILKADDAKLLDELQDNPVIQQWWQYMSDIMETNDDNSPVSTPLKEVFHLS